MKKDCDCRFCKDKINEYFCSSCAYNFNECESFHAFDYIVLCPKCHPENAMIAASLYDWIYCKIQEMKNSNE